MLSDSSGIRVNVDGNNSVARIEFPSNGSSLPFFDVQLLDINADGYWDVEVTGNCGNKVCEKKLYVYSLLSHEFFLFYDGGYEFREMDGGFLVTGGASGCCEYEYNAQKVTDFYAPAARDISFTISVHAPDADGRAQCIFRDGAGVMIPPPAHSLVRYCNKYGGYILIDPSGKAPTDPGGTSNIHR